MKKSSRRTEAKTSPSAAHSALTSLYRYITKPAQDKRGLMVHMLSSAKMNNAEDVAEISRMIAPSVRLCTIVTGLVVVFFGLWGTIAPIDSAAIAHGSVVLQSNRKTIQHLEGGIIEEIYVKDGDMVQQGQPLVRLNNTQSTAKQELVSGQLFSAQAAESRMLAERDIADHINFPANLLTQKNDPAIEQILDSQQRLFDTNITSLKGQVDVLQQQIAQYEQQIQGLNAQITSVKDQHALITEEIQSVEKLFKLGLAEKPRLLALKRTMADLMGKQGEYLSDISKIRESITETQLQIYNIRNEHMKKTVADLEETQKQIADLEEQLRAAKDISDRTTIFAPQSGKITGLKFHTLGGVIAPGTPIMDIIPQDDRLLIEAYVSPQDIDVVHEGLPAKVMLSAYKSRYVPRLAGKVISVSADRLLNDHTGEPYYLARITIEDNILTSLSQNIELYPGMPAEVYIVIGSRSLLGYLFTPILNTFHKAFKEE